MSFLQLQSLGAMHERQRSTGSLLFQAFSLMVVVALLSLAAYPSLLHAEPPLKKASLIPLWSPQAQFAGYYVALEKGLYRRYGVELTILNGGSGNSPVEALQSGRADYAVIWLTTALRHRDAGIRLVNISQVIQRSSMMLISRKSSRIDSLQGMNGKKVGLWDGDLSIPPLTLFSRRGITIRQVPLTNTVNLFLRGGIEVTSAMWYNEYHVILNSGVDADELNAVFLSEQGVNFPEDGIYGLEKTVKGDPALAAAIADASREGWQYAFDHPEEALDIVMKYMLRAHVPANRMHQKWMLNRMRDIIMPGTAFGKLPSGTLDRKDYHDAGNAMQRAGLIGGYPDYADFTWRHDAVQ